MTSSTTPQDRAVDEAIKVGAIALNGYVERHALDRWDRTAGVVVRALADAGLLSSGTQEDQGDGSLRSEPAAPGEVSVYVQLSGRAVSHTVEHYNGAVMVDMDDYDEPVGVEILDARKVTINGRQVHPPEAIGEAAKEKP